MIDKRKLIIIIGTVATIATIIGAVIILFKHFTSAEFRQAQKEADLGSFDIQEEEKKTELVEFSITEPEESQFMGWELTNSVVPPFMDNQFFINEVNKNFFRTGEFLETPCDPLRLTASNIIAALTYAIDNNIRDITRLINDLDRIKIEAGELQLQIEAGEINPFPNIYNTNIVASAEQQIKKQQCRMTSHRTMEEIAALNNLLTEAIDSIGSEKIHAYWDLLERWYTHFLPIVVQWQNLGRVEG